MKYKCSNCWRCVEEYDTQASKLILTCHICKKETTWIPIDEVDIFIKYGINKESFKKSIQDCIKKEKAIDELGLIPPKEYKRIYRCWNGR